ncbi:toxin-antitoxin system YwqK family antitoxin [Lewinella sp. IMCC34191]|uniref:toxin-antitoxin system YwqK family antitoxin n=1 Tax=Lewinella sp. IMCC34191 TaxID=2259172 RepID=UPI000E280C0F|nr:hypothetical protein [Lewinella sp. IMCC34191]
MTRLPLFCLLILAVSLLQAQDVPFPDTTGRAFQPMSATIQQPANYGIRYFLRGADTSFTGVLYGRYDNGELLTVQEYEDGLGNGTWINFNPDGTKFEQGTYRNNRVEGPVVRYYDDGSVKARGQYRHWKQPIEEWTFYDREGNVVHTQVYTR